MKRMFRKTMGNVTSTTDDEKLLNIIKEKPNLLTQIQDKNISTNKELFLELIQSNVDSIAFADIEIWNELNYVLKLIKTNPQVITHAPPHIKNNKQVLLECVEQQGSLLYCASEELKNDQELVSKAIQKDGFSFQYASDELKKDKQFLLSAIKNPTSSNALKFVKSRKLLNDKEFAMTLVKLHGNCLKYFNSDIKSDQEIVLAAVKENQHALRHASEKMIKNNIQFIKKAMKEVKSHSNLSKQLELNCGDSIYKNCSNELKQDRELCILAVNENGSNLKHAPDELKNDKEIVMIAVSKSGLALDYASEELKDDEDVIHQAIKKNPSSIFSASSRLQNDKSILLDCIRKDPTLIKLINRELVKEDPIYFIEAFLCASNVLSSLFLHHEELVIIAKKIIQQGFDENIALQIFQYCINTMPYEKYEPKKRKKKLSDSKFYARKSSALERVETLEISKPFQKVEKLFFYGEVSHELANLYFNGNVKNFEKAKYYFEQAISFGFSNSLIPLNKLKMMMNSLNENQISTIEKCSNERDYKIKKLVYFSMERSVYVVQNKKDKMDYAMKQIKIDITDFNDVLKETSFLLNLKNEFVCGLKDFYIKNTEEDDYFFCMIMPLYHTDLHEYLKLNEVSQKVKFGSLNITDD
jgi:predicted DNA-binding ArsR family transcriptional regulator